MSLRAVFRANIGAIFLAIKILLNCHQLVDDDVKVERIEFKKAVTAAAAQ